MAATREPNEVEAWKLMMDSMIKFIAASTKLMNTINNKAEKKPGECQSTCKGGSAAPMCEVECLLCPTRSGKECGLCPVAGIAGDSAGQKGPDIPATVEEADEGGDAVAAEAPAEEEPAAEESPAEEPPADEPPADEEAQEGAEPPAPPEGDALNNLCVCAELRQIKDAARKAGVAVDGDKTKATKSGCSCGGKYSKAPQPEAGCRCKSRAGPSSQDSQLCTCSVGPKEKQNITNELAERVNKAQQEISALQQEMNRLQHLGPPTQSQALYNEIMKEQPIPPAQGYLAPPNTGQSSPSTQYKSVKRNLFGNQFNESDSTSYGAPLPQSPGCAGGGPPRSPYFPNRSQQGPGGPVNAGGNLPYYNQPNQSQQSNQEPQFFTMNSSGASSVRTCGGAGGPNLGGGSNRTCGGAGGPNLDARLPSDQSNRTPQSPQYDSFLGAPGGISNRTCGAGASHIDSRLPPQQSYRTPQSPQYDSFLGAPGNPGYRPQGYPSDTMAFSPQGPPHTPPKLMAPRTPRGHPSYREPNDLPALDSFFKEGGHFLASSPCMVCTSTPTESLPNVSRYALQGTQCPAHCVSQLPDDVPQMPADPNDNSMWFDEGFSNYYQHQNDQCGQTEQQNANDGVPRDGNYDSYDDDYGCDDNTCENEECDSPYYS